MQKVDFFGKEYRFVLRGCRDDYEISSGIGYDSSTDYYFDWKGEGKLTRLVDGVCWVFRFRTDRINKHWRREWTNYYGQSLENNVFSISGKGLLIDHRRVTDLSQIIDLQVEAILEQLEGKTEIIPWVIIGSLGVDKLRKLGLLPMPDGQFAMAGLTEK